MYENALLYLVELFSWPGPLLLIGGALIGLFFGIMPGLGGPQVVALLIPLSLVFEPNQAIVLLVAAMGATAIGGSIPAILINTPGTGESGATMLDGYPLSQQGKADQALGAAIFSSVLGAIVGAMALTLLLPLGKHIVLAISYPEYFMMALMGLSIIAVVSQGSLWKALIAAGLGFLAASFGYDPVTGETRYTFGSIYLMDGLKLIPVIIGIFAIGEALALMISNKKQIVNNNKVKTSFSGTFIGMGLVLKNFSTFIRGSLIGTIIGIIPGVGGSVSTFLAYGQAIQAAKDKSKFGKGDIRGVIAPESANNAKDGGSLIPTLLFGIPGSAQMAVLIGALMIHGIQPGPRMMTDSPSIVLTLIYVLVFSNLVVGVVSIILASPLSKITLLPTEYIVPCILVVSMVGAYATDKLFGDVIVAVVFGFIGLFLKLFDFSRIAFIIALVLGSILEKSLHQTLIVMGPEGFITRPISLIMLLVTIIILFYPLLRQLKKG